MTNDDGEELDRLTRRLQSRYPDVSENDVRDAVSDAARLLADARLRQYAMVLIEKCAIDICRRRRLHLSELTTSGVWN